MGNLSSALQYLRDNRVKKGDSPQSAARSERMNALTDAILALSRSEHVRKGPGIYIKASEGSLVISARSESGGGGSAVGHPFQVYESLDNSEPPYPVIKVAPGKFAGVVPTLGGIALDHVATDPFDPTACFYPPATNMSLYLRVVIDVTNAEAVLYRSGVTGITVRASDDPTIAADLDPLAPGGLHEWKMFWDEPEPENELHGHFYILIADLHNASVDGNIVTKHITQWLYQNYRTFLIGGEAVPFV